MPQGGSRKRPAPGTSPVVKQLAQPSPNYSMNSPQVSNEQAMQWGPDNGSNGTSTYPDPSGSFNPNIYNTFAQAQVRPSEPSNQLTRRPASQHILTRGSPFTNGESETWPGFTNGALQPPREENWVKDDDNLEQKAMGAKREAQTRRKLIPPFVQKLSSFLEESRNTELIRWSSSGDSFIVVDEDEFAKTLIPELFKHNNYASFVRQLNMYGFHKKVGLSDNSMRASEKKNKSPSEYYNPYFKRGRPNLLWLIQKPRGAQGKGKGGSRSKQDEVILDDGAEELYDVDSPGPMNQGVEENAPNPRGGRHPLMIGQGGGGNLPSEELAAVQRELQAVRQHQQMIQGAIQKLKRDHEHQAAAFQELHNRHENSINAILTFLATIYNRSLEGHNAPNLADLFAGAIPHGIQNQGNVVDIGDYPNSDVGTPNDQPGRPIRRQPLLLQAPPPNDHTSRDTTASPAASGLSEQSQNRPPTTREPSNRCPVNPSSSNRYEPVRDKLDQSPLNGASQSPQFTERDDVATQPPERDIMSIINSANANDTTFLNNRMDFPQALSHIQTADGKSPLTQDQRNNVLQLIANGGAGTNLDGNTNKNNNALTSPTPPEIPVPGISHWNATKDELDFLEKTLREQESKVANLSSMVQPLSPSGSIPGLTDPPGYGGQGNSDPLDLDQIFNSGDYFNDTASVADIDFGNGDVDFGSGADFNFDSYDNTGLSSGFDVTDHAGTGVRIAESGNSSEATSPANTVIDGGGGEEGRSPRKKRRRN